MTVWGQSVAVCGSIPALGSWDVSRCAPLVCHVSAAFRRCLSVGGRGLANSPAPRFARVARPSRHLIIPLLPGHAVFNPPRHLPQHEGDELVWEGSVLITPALAAAATPPDTSLEFEYKYVVVNEVGGLASWEASLYFLPLGKVPLSPGLLPLRLRWASEDEGGRTRSFFLFLGGFFPPIPPGSSCHYLLFPAFRTGC